MPFLLEQHRNLPAYVPGDHVEGSGHIRLNTNESPFPPPKAVADAVAAEIGNLNTYNDPDCTRLRETLASRFGVGTENVMVGNGSDELLYFIFMAYADANHPIALPDITYGYYDLFAAALGIPLIRKPLKKDFTMELSDYVESEDTVLFPNPNAPTGQTLTVSQIETILQSKPNRLVIVDEAYADFGAESVLPLIDRYENLIVVRTFSKSRSLAGARIGFGFAQAQRVAEVEKIRNAVNLYSVSRMAQAAAVASLNEPEEHAENCRKIMQARTYTIQMLRDQGFDVLDSLGNFVFAKPHAMGAGALAAQLRERGILVRHWDQERIRDYLRITIGTMAQMQALEAAIEMIFGRA